MMRAACGLVCLASCLAIAACGRKAPAFPTGTGVPFPEFASAYDRATAGCRSIKTFTASMALAGKAGRTKLRGRIDAGFAAPAKMRLEGRAPFGRPLFVLTADGDRATLVLPRDERVLADAAPDQIVDALAGVALGPDALRTVLSGCGLAIGSPTEGREYGGGWAAVTVDGATAYLRRTGATWQLVGATRGNLTVSYADVTNNRPSTIRLRTGSSGREPVDLTLRLSQVETNTSLHPRTFQAELPEHAVPLTLEELRRAGPLGETTKGT